MRIAVVIPTYNRASLVVRAIQSALAQGGRPDEVIVVDDGSTDDTPACVEPFADRIRYVRQTNAGGASARNRGTREASADWIAFLDSDDLWTPGHLQRMLQAIESTAGEANYYFADTERPGGEGSLWRRSGFSIEGDHSLRCDSTAWVLSPLQPMMLQSSVFHRQRYLASGGLWERLVRRHDTHLFFKLGLGQPSCAVAGAGSVMTADDPSSVRLTTAHDGRSRVYWECTEALYGDVLQRARELAPGALRELRRRKESAHWRLARVSLAERDWVECGRQLLRCTRTDPLGLAARPLGSLARRLARASGRGGRSA